MSVRTRFAPSPTGYLHLGGARTALYAWAHARRNSGVFVLRIEDTDRERSDPAMTDRILESLRWLGLDWDEGPFFQSERTALYDRHIATLLEKDLAYECFCAPEELEARRKASVGEADAFRYDGRCGRLSREERARRAASSSSRPAVRLRVRSDVPTEVDDALRGLVVFEAGVLDDLVIRKSDGSPTFHFAVAFDDALMGITDVIRGDDHLSNTPKQVRILEALRAATGDDRFRVPRYCHLPLILGEDGKRFSKRHGATAIGEYRERGFLPEALVNYLALLGWNPGDDREIFTRGELVSLFGFDRVHLKGAVFDEKKLLWMNGKYLAALPAPRVIELLGPDFARGVDDAALASWGVTLPRASWLEQIVALGRDRSAVLAEIAHHVEYFLRDAISRDAEAESKHFKGEDLVARLEAGLAAVEDPGAWSVEELDRRIRATAEARGFKPPKVMHPLRVAVTGRMLSPGLFETIFLVGRERAARRIREAIAAIRTRPPAEPDPNPPAGR